jgi:hypothetical protein
LETATNRITKPIDLDNGQERNINSKSSIRNAPRRRYGPAISNEDRDVGVVEKKTAVLEGSAPRKEIDSKLPSSKSQVSKKRQTRRALGKKRKGKKRSLSKKRRALAKRRKGKKARSLSKKRRALAKRRKGKKSRSLSKKRRALAKRRKGKKARSLSKKRRALGKKRNGKKRNGKRRSLLSERRRELAMKEGGSQLEGENRTTRYPKRGSRPRFRSRKSLANSGKKSGFGDMRDNRGSPKGLWKPAYPQQDVPLTGGGYPLPSVGNGMLRQGGGVPPAGPPQAVPQQGSGSDFPQALPQQGDGSELPQGGLGNTNPETSTILARPPLTPGIFY